MFWLFFIKKRVKFVELLFCEPVECLGCSLPGWLLKRPAWEQLVAPRDFGDSLFLLRQSQRRGCLDQGQYPLSKCYDMGRISKMWLRGHETGRALFPCVKPWRPLGGRRAWWALRHSCDAYARHPGCGSTILQLKEPGPFGEAVEVWDGGNPRWGWSISCSAKE